MNKDIPWNVCFWLVVVGFIIGISASSSILHDKAKNEPSKLLEHRLTCLENEFTEHACTSIIHGTQDRPEYPCSECKGTLHNPSVVNGVVFWWCARCGHRTLISKLSDSIGPEWRDIWKVEKKE